MNAVILEKKKHDEEKMVSYSQAVNKDEDTLKKEVDMSDMELIKRSVKKHKKLLLKLAK